MAALYKKAIITHCPGGGVQVVEHSTITMPPGSNTIEGNGRVGHSVVQWMLDETSNRNV